METIVGNLQQWDRTRLSDNKPFSPPKMEIFGILFHKSLVMVTISDSTLVLIGFELRSVCCESALPAARRSFAHKHFPVVEI